ncbi:hypothetical protein ABVT39_024119 [Epinephelus coioides]
MPAKGTKVEMKPDEEYVSLTQMNELLNQQNEMFTALLQQQQDDFKGFVKIIMDSTNTRLDEMSKQLQDIKTNLQFTQKDVDDIKADNVKQAESGLFKYVTVC